MLPVTSCFLPGACAAGNVASVLYGRRRSRLRRRARRPPSDASCNGVDDDCNGAADEDYAAGDELLPAGRLRGRECGVVLYGQASKPRCATGTPAADDASCNGIDEDCSGVADEDYVPVTSCFLPGACAAGNVASSVRPASKRPARRARRRRGRELQRLDEDCSGARTRTMSPVTSCFLPGACAAGNVASTCISRHRSGLRDGHSGGEDASCNGIDEDCNGRRTRTTPR